jgi:transposase-like protein
MSARLPRAEIITRGERRRRWAPEQKREIVAESYGPELAPTEVARKHGISSGQFYIWWHERWRRSCWSSHGGQAALGWKLSDPKPAGGRPACICS